jgi:hypothetical protein
MCDKRGGNLRGNEGEGITCANMCYRPNENSQVYNYCDNDINNNFSNQIFYVGLGPAVDNIGS